MATTKQLSVFIENRAGRIERICQVMSENSINIVSISLADSSEFGLLRMVVSNPTLAKEKLAEAGFTASLADVLVVRMDHKVGTLHHAVMAISQAGINVKYMYVLSTGKDSASILIKTSDNEEAQKKLEAQGLIILEPETVYSLNS